jgi:hypothetical protein
MLAPKTKGEGVEPLEDILATYTEALEGEWKHMLGYALAAIAVALLWSVIVGRRRATEPWAGERWLRLSLVLGLIGLGLYTASENATCFDDAYISLRYAENLVDGHGLVYNVGEYVEGYTNFLWTMLVALFVWLTPVEAPLLAVLGSMLAFAINLWVVWRISLKIAPPFHPRAFAFPIAVALLAVQNTFTDYGTTGLETAFASLLVNLGVLALITADDAKHTFWAGLCWILATLNRPDHALFYAIGSVVVLGVWIRPTWRARKSGLRTIWREGLRPMATYAAPFLIWLIYSAWKLHYYGELLPNTYYAKSANLTYYSQGLIYALAFHVSSHLWLVLIPLFVLWPWRGPSNLPGRRFAAYAIPAVLLYEWYVVRVGGDFMEGRFYVTLIPLMLLAGEQLVHEFSLSRAHRKAARAQIRASSETSDSEPSRRNPLAIGAMLLVGVMAASAVGVRLIPARKSYWHLTDESSYYPIVRWSPMVIDHANYRVGIALGKIEAGLDAQGIPEAHRPILASGAIGLIGYYSRMTLIDRLGLTDATVAHQKIRTRGRPGHEKWATSKYLRKRGVHFRRGGGYTRWFKTYGTMRWSPGTGGRHWWVLVYDRVMMNAIREAYPDVYFHDFEIYIDKYIARLPHTDVKKARREFKFFRSYYFDHNDDPERRAAFSTYFKWIKDGHKPRELLDDKRWDVYKDRAVEANKLEGELRRARAERTRMAQRWRDPWRFPQLRRQYLQDVEIEEVDPNGAPPSKTKRKPTPTPTPRKPSGPAGPTIDPADDPAHDPADDPAGDDADADDEPDAPEDDGDEPDDDGEEID